MATVTNTTVTVTDDLDGKNGAETVLFSLDGVDYSIDLGALNRKNFRASMQKYIDAAKVVTPVKARKSKTSAKPNGDASLIREWARTNGIAVGERGRLNPSVIEAFNAAQTAPVEPVAVEA